MVKKEEVKRIITLAIIALFSWFIYQGIDYSILFSFTTFMILSVFTAIYWEKKDNCNSVELQSQSSYEEKKEVLKKPEKTKTQKKQPLYTIKNDDTFLDNYLKIIRDTFTLEINSFKISGLTSVPRKIAYNQEWIRKSSNTFEKLIKINFQLDTKAYGLYELYQVGIQKYHTNPQNNYKKLVIKPCSDYLNKTYGEKLKLIDQDYYLTASPFQEKTSVWINIWMPYNVHTYLRQNSNGLTPFAKEHISEISKLLENELVEIAMMKSFCSDKVFRNKILKKYENKLRNQRGVPKIGQGNLSQYTLFSLLKKHYSNVKYEYSPKWLNRMRFDIYIPSLKVAIEYNGLQHYEPVEIFGGEEGFKETQRRDREKIQRANENGVLVYEWEYHRKVTDIEVKKFIDEMNS